MATRNYWCPANRKKQKSTHGLSKHRNICPSLLVFSIYMQPKQDTLIPEKDTNTSENVKAYKDEKLILKE